MRQTGYKVFSVELDDGRMVKRHEHQLRRRVDEVEWKPVAEDGESDEESVYEDAEIEVPLPVEGRPRRKRMQTEF